MKPATLIIAGAGGRGAAYANYVAAHPDRGKVVGVAEPIDLRRNRIVERHDVPAANVFTDWVDLAARPKFADAVMICTQDAMHAEPALAFAEKGYHILLEKPLAPTEKECTRIIDAVKKAGVLFAVCHVLRYTRYTRMLKQVVDSGELGDVVCMDHLEPVGYWHQAHAFTRGHWRNTAESSFMLLAKSCHDLDWMHYVLGKHCTSLASFGALSHFCDKGKPEGAAERCLDCKIEQTCPYSALKIYLRDRFDKGVTGWPVRNLTDDEITLDSLTRALRTGPYGRCVYACDNDVVDHQVVAMNFDDGATASFTMTGFTRMRGRQTRIHGTRGELRGDSSNIEIYDYLTDTTRTIDTNASTGDITGGHGGGDEGLMHGFLEALNTGDASKILTGPDDTLESHRMVFAAEKSRLENRVVSL